ncbi:MAG TPA: N-acetylmuramoyl-L-alanine amidase, partial [Thermoanaerobaculia bacterium]|nr:N-acetylmuramoyl-L-alanine amidase [Thermoanaerobaculia bacterium]
MTRFPLRLALLAAALLPCLLAAQEPAKRVDVSEDFSAVLDDGAIVVEVRPLEGESVADFARRVSRDEGAAARLLALATPPSRTRTILLPYAGLSDETRLAAARALFPSDARATIGWLHVAVGSEPLSSIASWFTGDERLAVRLGEINGLTGPVVTRGTLVKVPVEYLLPPFRDAEPIPDEEPPRLEYGEDEKGKFAVYRLKRKEALYSAVVVRFTGRLHAGDVIQLALDIALRSGIDDVHGIPVGFPVKIPLEYLAEEYLPPDDPKTAAREKERAEAALFATPAKARGLAGVRVVIDAGHGGRDTGTLHHGVWESTYVYDVASRLRKVLLETTRAEVVMTTREPGIGWEVPDRDRLPDAKFRVLLTDPPYRLNDPVAGVNLRWYLANAVLRRPGPGGKPIPPERTVFLSLHADSLHPSVRGAMAYVPGERFLRSSYGRGTPFYQGFREVRDEPVVSFSRKDRVLAEGVSTALAEKLIGAFRRRNLAVHQFRPVRTHVIRSGREWVPAVLRYNKIPNRVLFELSNLSNDEDRELTLTRAFRQQSAEALAEGLVAFFGGAAAEKEEGPAAPAAEPRPIDARGEIAGPWPEIAGPWPPAPRATPRATRSPTPKPTRSPTPKPARR